MSVYKINDTNPGLADGNGNAIPENGEIIELIPLVKKNGIGNAINVNLSTAQESEKGSYTIIFFAGHGAPEDDPASPDQDKIRKYLLTKNN